MAKWKEIRKTLKLTPLYIEELDTTFQLRPPSTRIAFKLGGKGDAALEAIRELVMECVMDRLGVPVFDTTEEVDEIPINAYKPIVDGIMALLGDTVRVGSEQVDADLLAARFEAKTSDGPDDMSEDALAVKSDQDSSDAGATDTASEGSGEPKNASSGEVDTLSAKSIH